MRLTGRPAHQWQRAVRATGAGRVEGPKIHPGKEDVSHGVWKVDGLGGDKPDTPREIALIRKQTQSTLDQPQTEMPQSWARLVDLGLDQHFQDESHCSS